MTYTIYGARGCGSSIVEAACGELGVEYRTCDLDVKNGENRGDAYRAIHPQGKMPALGVDDSEVITESVAIVLTLDERHREAGLLPPPASKQRAQALRWMLFAATELYPLVDIIDYPKDYASEPDRAEAVRERAKALWRERWSIVDKSIAGSPYCLEDGFSAADLFLAILSRWDMPAKWRSEQLPRVEALAAAVAARPAVAPIWARHAFDS